MKPSDLAFIAGACFFANVFPPALGVGLGFFCWLLSLVASSAEHRAARRRQGLLQADIRALGIALNATHNTVTTDMPNAKVDDTHWRIDHTQEIAALQRVAKALNTSIAP